MSKILYVEKIGGKPKTYDEIKKEYFEDGIGLPSFADWLKQHSGSEIYDLFVKYTKEQAIKKLQEDYNVHIKQCKKEAVWDFNDWLNSYYVKIEV